MSTKNIPLDEDAYNRLKNLKDDGESFSDVVKKVTDERSLKEIAGIISDEEATEDCKIAGIAIKNSEKIVTKDKDFETISKYSTMETAEFD